MSRYVYTTLTIAFLVMGSPRSAVADPINQIRLDVIPPLDAIQVLEGEGGEISFTVKNLEQFAVQVGSSPTLIAPTDENDDNIVVSSLMLKPTGCGENPTILARQLCIYTFSFRTEDKSPVSDADRGMWSVKLIVAASKVGNPAIQGTAKPAIGRISVNDPDVVAEPGTFAALATGLVGLAFRRKAMGYWIFCARGDEDSPSTTPLHKDCRSNYS